MEASKKLTSKNGLTIPKQIRAEAGFFPGMAVDIKTTAEGINITPHVPVCRFCGGIEKVVRIMDIEVCRGCGGSLRKGLEQYGF